ncbi:hypothetical protein P4597_27465 [Peribacillus simplex]|uniref:hypothetical protein n=1 Tax=Peribacillus simplex TaxID=1478 RepID=UPI002E1AEBFC|nr:hypothetical protein [Peribacillus simplex]
MNIKQFEGFRFSVGDTVIVKETETVGTVSQCRYEIVSNKKDEYVVEQKYQVKYGAYSQKMCTADEIRYVIEMNPNMEDQVLSVLVDVNLMDEKNHKYAKQFNEERNNLKEKKDESNCE